MAVKVILLALVALIVAGVVFLASWDMPPPTAVTEKVIPNDRFQ